MRQLQIPILAHFNSTDKVTLKKKKSSGYHSEIFSFSKAYMPAP